jgi:hypothetical protein
MVTNDLIGLLISIVDFRWLVGWLAGVQVTVNLIGWLVGRLVCGNGWSD